MRYQRKPHPCPNCLVCGADISERTYHSRYCLKCYDKVQALGGAGKAWAEVNKAVQRGDIPPAKTLSCMDCGKQARDYDHRDYSKPLQVDAVCRSCNRKRGPGVRSGVEADVALLASIIKPVTQSA